MKWLLMLVILKMRKFLNAFLCTKQWHARQGCQNSWQTNKKLAFNQGQNLITDPMKLLCLFKSGCWSSGSDSSVVFLLFFLSYIVFSLMWKLTFFCFTFLTPTAAGRFTHGSEIVLLIHSFIAHSFIIYSTLLWHKWLISLNQWKAVNAFLVSLF